MKKVLISIAAIVAAVSCQKAEFNSESVPATGNVGVSFVVTESTTKTILDENDSYWAKGDKMKMFLGVPKLANPNAGGKHPYQVELTNGAEDKAKANFTGSLADGVSVVESGATGAQVNAGTYTCYGFYNANRFKSNLAANAYSSLDNTIVAVEMPSTQYPTAEGLDPSSDFLVAEPFEVTLSADSEDPVEVSTRFARAQAIIKILFTDNTTGTKLTDKKVYNASITATNANLAGYAQFDLKANGGFNGEMFNNSWGEPSKSINANCGEGFLHTNGVFINTIPQIIYSGDKLTITATIGSYTISKTVTLSSDIELLPGTVRPIKVSISDTEVSLNPFEGAGTSKAPYLITSKEDLVTLATLSNGTSKADYLDKYYKQTADITLTESFARIAATNLDEAAFTGNYDGNDFSISGLTITASATNGVGMFGTIKKATIQNVKIVNPSVTATGACNHVGILVGEAKGGIISNCQIIGNGSTTNLSKENNPSTAAILGGTTTSATTISNCVVDGVVINQTGTNAQGVAALAGRARSNLTITGCSVKNSSVTTTNNATSCYGVGGILGIVDQAVTVNISECVVGSKCKINAGYQMAGGILGGTKLNVAANVTINRCFVYGDVSATNQFVGGIIGGAAPEASGTSTHTAGGSLIVSNSSFIGGNISTSLSGGSNQLVGGILGGSHRQSEGEKALKVYLLNNSSCPGKMTSAPTGDVWSLGGISGAMYAHQYAWTCWSNITTGTISVGSSKKYGAISPQCNGGTYSCSMYYCFGLIDLKNAGSFVIGGDSAKLDALTGSGDGTLLSKLNAGISAYTANVATLDPWNEGANYPVLSSTIADPDTK